MSVFSQRIKQLKAEKGALQKNIAEYINVSTRAYQYYERDEREPTLSVLIALADYFNVSIDYLVGRTDNPEINK